MARGKIEFNTFVKGIVTEAGPLTFPENASLDEANFVLNRDGSRQRRFGIDFEEGSSSVAIASTGAYVSTHTWENPGNSGIIGFTVVQDGDTLRFFDSNTAPIVGDPVQIDDGGAVDFITLSAWEVTEIVSTASIHGKLYVAGDRKEVYEFTYNTVSGLIEYRSYGLSMRDLWGVYEDLGVDERPSTLSAIHNYNLQNQGWLTRFICSDNSWGGNARIRNPITYTREKQPWYPSSTDQLHLYKFTAGKEPITVGSFSPWEMDKSVEGTSKAPKGSVILESVWDRGTSRFKAKSVLGLPVDSSIGVISAVAPYAGRLFYSFYEEALTGGDLNSPNLSTLIAYSQVGTENVGKCYNSNDPSAETFNDVLDTDGGYIVLPELGRVHTMLPLGDSLFVFSSNGVWEIHGGEGSFSASNQNVAKVTNVGSIGKQSIVASEDAISFWSRGGIYTITLDKVSLRGTPQNVTQSTIQTLYDSIPPAAKLAASGVYDSVSRQVRWLYRDKELSGERLYNAELILDLNLSAFYVNKFSEIPDEGVDAYPVGYIDVANVIFTSTARTVTSGGEDVTSGGETVTAGSRYIAEGVRLSTKYLGAYTEDGTSWKYTGCTLNNTEFYDWPQLGEGGVDSPAFLDTGYWTGGESGQDKRINYLHTHFRQTEGGFTDDGAGGLIPIGESSCLVRAKWQWTDSPDANRWGPEFQAYRLPRMYVPEDELDLFNNGWTVVTTKNKLRGHGKALSLSFRSEAGKDCHLYGWVTDITQEDN